MSNEIRRFSFKFCEAFSKYVLLQSEIEDLTEKRIPSKINPPLQFEQVLDKIDDNLDSNELCEIYELCQDALESDKLSEKTLLFLVKSLKKKNAGLLNTYFKDLVCPIETSKLLLIVCKASSDEKYQKILQNDKSLLIETIFLLKMMHDTEKSNGNLHKKDSEIIEDSPINGFKCNLVRLIGNLTYRNKANQDEVSFIKIDILRS